MFQKTKIKNRINLWKIGILFFVILFCLPEISFAAKKEFIVGTVDEVISTRIETEEFFGERSMQELRVTLHDSHQVVTIENDTISFRKGDKIYVEKTTDDSGVDHFAFAEAYRLPILFWLALLFVIVSIGVGGKQGARGLLSLLGSLFVIGGFLLPEMAKGHSPLLISIIASGVIIIAGSYITHGFNRTTTAAVLGMLITISGTGVLAWLAVNGSHFSGLASDEALFLRVQQTNMDLGGLLLGGILIGLLGVLYDAAIGQAVFVEELFGEDGAKSIKTVWRQAMRVGREHIGALVDTLAIAYVGASLPLFLLFYTNISTKAEPMLYLLNKEFFSSEILRILIGSIGLILAVPITTLVSIYMLRHSPKREGVTAHGHHH